MIVRQQRIVDELDANQEYLHYKQEVFPGIERSLHTLVEVMEPLFSSPYLTSNPAISMRSCRHESDDGHGQKEQ